MHLNLANHRWNASNDTSNAFFSAGDLSEDFPLESSKGKIKDDFDQMKFNEEKFGLTDDYDESRYTTVLKPEDFTADQLKKAEKLS